MVKYLYKFFVWLPVQMIRRRMLPELLLFLYLGYVDGVVVPNPNMRSRETSFVTVVGVVSALVSWACIISLVLFGIGLLLRQPPISERGAILLMVIGFASTFLCLALSAFQTKYRSSLRSRQQAVEDAILFVRNHLGDGEQLEKAEEKLLRYAKKYVRPGISDTEKVEFILDTLVWERFVSELEKDESDLKEDEKESPFSESKVLQDLERRVVERSFSVVTERRRSKVRVL